MADQIHSIETSHSIIIEGRRKTSVTGVTDMESFDESEIVLGTTAGTLVLHGSELHVEKLDLAAGNVAVTGYIESLDYENNIESGGLFSRLFK